MTNRIQRPLALKGSARLLVMAGLFLAAAGSSWAETRARTPEGVSLGHLHFNATDVEATKRFWMSVLGAEPANLAGLQGVRLQDTFIWIEKGEVAGGTDQSVIRHVGIKVRDLDGVLARAARGRFHSRQSSRSSADLLAPDAAMIELVGDAGMDADGSLDHVQFLVPDAAAARQWYSDRFGPLIQGIRLEFVSADKAARPMKGRALDHIGLSVSDLETFQRFLPAPDLSPQASPFTQTKSALLTDPWGVRIELVEDRRR